MTDDNRLSFTMLYRVLQRQHNDVTEAFGHQQSCHLMSCATGRCSASIMTLLRLLATSKVVT
jgi:hypothetical protein